MQGELDSWVYGKRYWTASRQDPIYPVQGFPGLSQGVVEHQQKKRLEAAKALRNDDSLFEFKPKNLAVAAKS